MSEADDVKYLDRNPPAHEPEAVLEIMSRLYGLRGRLDDLDSERDQNHLFSDHEGRRYVLKIANIAETIDVIDMQVRALQHIAITDPMLPVPRVVPSAGGRDYQLAGFPDGSEHIVYLFSYLEGVPLEQIGDRSAAVTYRDLGVFMARVDIALRGFFHPAASQERRAGYRIAKRVTGTPQRTCRAHYAY